MKAEIDADELEVLRAAAVAAITRWNIRAVAREIGVAHGTLHKFVSDLTVQPRLKTLSLLRGWHYRRSDLESAMPAAIIAELTRFVRRVPDPERGVRVLLTAIESVFEEQGMFVPEWASRCRKGLASSEDGFRPECNSSEPPFRRNGFRSV